MSQKLQTLYDKDARIPDLSFDQKTAMIYFKKSIAGKKVKFSTGIKLPEVPPHTDPERRLAIERAKRVANKNLNQKLNVKKVRVSTLVKDELESWLKVKEAEGISEATLIKVKSAKEQIGEYWGDKFPDQITRDSLPEWYSWWRVNRPDIEMENAVKYMRNFTKYLAGKIIDGRALLPMAPAIKDPRAKEIKAMRKKKKEKILAHADLVKIIETAESEADQLVVLIMYTMATRIAETLNMRFGEEILIDQDPPIYKWTLGQNKADLWGEHDLHSILIPRLKALKLLRDKEGTGLLFPQLHNKTKSLKAQQIDWGAWRTRAAAGDGHRVGLHWTPHTFRHTCLSNLFNDEKNPQALICKLYRTSLAVALDTYIKVTTSGKARMRDAIEVKL